MIGDKYKTAEMIMYIKILFLFILLIGCRSYKYALKLEVLTAQQNILLTENLEKKINKLAKGYADLQPHYSSNGKSIYLDYTSINYNSKDSIVQGRYNPNSLKIDSITSINGLSIAEVSFLKTSILKLANFGLKEQTFFIFDENPAHIKGIYLYKYSYEDWMLDNPEKIGYLSFLSKAVLESEYFKKIFTIRDKKESAYLLTIN